MLFKSENSGTLSLGRKAAGGWAVSTGWKRTGRRLRVHTRLTLRDVSLAAGSPLKDKWRTADMRHALLLTTNTLTLIFGKF